MVNFLGNNSIGDMALRDTTQMSLDLGITMEVPSLSISGRVLYRHPRPERDADFLAGVGISLSNKDIHIVYLSPELWPIVPPEGSDITLSIRPGLIYKLSKSWIEAIDDVAFSISYAAYREALDNSASADSSGNRKYTDLPENIYG